MEEKKVVKYRALRGPAGTMQRVLLALIPVCGIVYILRLNALLNITFWKEQYFAFFFAVVLSVLFLTTPATKRAPRDSAPWYDVVLSAASLVTGLYVAIFWQDIYYNMGVVTSTRVVFGSAAILLVFEGLRRVVGWPLIILCLLFIFYARWADLFPSLITGSPTPWPSLVMYLYFGLGGMLPMLAIAATIGVAFILFANILTVFRAAPAFTDFAFAIMGRFRGGAAKVAVIASSLVGTITGGAVTNVMIVGPITIPMMKDSGYRAEYAAAVESCSSTGGQLMPPVMGIAAFLIAQLLEIPYATVAIAAAIPAVLYYISLFVQVDLEAGRRGIKGIPRAKLPSLRSAAKRVWIFLVPLAILVYTLFIMNLVPEQAGIITALISLCLLFVIKENRRGFLSKTVNTLQNTTRLLFGLTVILAAAGFIVGTMTISGLASRMAFLLVQLTGGNTILLLIVTAITAYILGMGMPTPPAYLLVAVMAAPALVAQGIPELAAHLFVFYFAMLSNFTPPVAVAVFAAAGLAGSDPMRTGYIAMRLGILSYIVPFLFVYSPTLILSGSAAEIALDVVTAVIGTYMLGLSLVGYFVRRINWVKRLTLLLAAACLLVPSGLLQLFWILNLAGVVVALIILLPEWRSRGRPAPAALPAAD